MKDRKKKIVVNTSPWISLSLCGQVSVLNKLYTDVYIPLAVKEELLSGGKQKIGVKELDENSWIKIEAVKDIEKVKTLKTYTLEVEVK